MRITHKLAQDIVDKTMNILGRNVNIMDENGVIIGSGDKSRLNHFHEGAAQVIKEGKKLEIYSRDINCLVGAKPGINLPIEYNYKIIGVVGITGEPNEVTPFGEVIKMTVEMMLQQEFLLKELQLEQQARENFIQDLILGRTGNNPDLFVTRGQIVGYDFLVPRVALVMDIYQFGKTAQQSFQTFRGLKEEEIYLQRLKNDVVKTIQGIFVNLPQEVISYLGGDRFIVLKTIDLQDSDGILREKLFSIGHKIKNIISQKMKFKVTIGIGKYYKEIWGLSKSFREASQALDVGSRLLGAGDVYHVDNLGIGRLLTETKGKNQREFIEKTIYSTKGNKEKKVDEFLLETLSVFLIII